MKINKSRLKSIRSPSNSRRGGRSGVVIYRIWKLLFLLLLLLLLLFFFFFGFRRFSLIFNWFSLILIDSHWFSFFFPSKIIASSSFFIDFHWFSMVFIDFSSVFIDFGGGSDPRSYFDSGRSGGGSGSCPGPSPGADPRTNPSSGRKMHEKPYEFNGFCRFWRQNARVFAIFSK